MLTIEETLVKIVRDRAAREDRIQALKQVVLWLGVIAAISAAVWIRSGM